MITVGRPPPSLRIRARAFCRRRTASRPLGCAIIVRRSTSHQGTDPASPGSTAHIRSPECSGCWADRVGPVSGPGPVRSKVTFVPVGCPWAIKSIMEISGHPACSGRGTLVTVPSKSITSGQETGRWSHFDRHWMFDVHLQARDRCGKTRMVENRFAFTGLVGRSSTWETSPVGRTLQLTGRPS